MKWWNVSKRLTPKAPPSEFLATFGRGLQESRGSFAWVGASLSVTAIGLPILSRNLSSGEGLRRGLGRGREGGAWVGSVLHDWLRSCSRGCTKFRIVSGSGDGGFG